MITPRVSLLSFEIKLDRCAGSFNNINGLSNKVCVPKKRQDLNLSVFNMIADRNKSKTVTNHKSCECKCRFDTKDVIQINGEIATKCKCKCKNIMYVKKFMSGILVHVFVKMKNI